MGRRDNAKCILVLAILFSCALFGTARAEDQQPPEEPARDWVRMVTPREGSEVIQKKPVLVIEFTEGLSYTSLLVMLDGTDITQVLNVTEKGFEYVPIMVLPPGMHTLSITATDKEGRQTEKTFSFSSRHSKTFEEASSNNTLSLLYEGNLTKPEGAVSEPDSKVEANLGSDNRVRNQGWQATFNTNLRYFDQSTPVFPPQKKGFDIINWLFTGSYTKDRLRLVVNIGDIQVNESLYSVFGLARKGGSLAFEYDNLQVNLFSVNSQQFFGQQSGLGIGGNWDDHIRGFSAGLKLFDDRAEVRAIYAKGGEQGYSFGISSAAGLMKGDVLGVVLTSNFLENRLNTEFEGYVSKFDPDTADEFKAKSDRAYRLKVGGLIDNYTYEVLYEYIGRDYAVVGNQGLPKDKEGITVRGGANLGVHNINFMLSRYNDNVKGDELFPRIVNYEGSLDYSFNQIPSLPVGIGYQVSKQESTREPAGSFPLDLRTDTVTGRVNYMKEQINIGFQAAYSLMNDRTPANNDNSTVTYTLTPGYNTLNFSVIPNFSLNKSKNILADVTTDTYTITLDLRSKLFRQSMSFDVGGTYSIIKTDDGTVDSRNLNANFRLAYNIKNLLKGYVNPSIGLRGTYLKMTDRINPGSDSDEFTLFLVLATSVPFSF